jgi:VWFA-related protein
VQRIAAAWIGTLLSLAAAQDTTIRTRVNLVVTPVTVTDRQGHFVDGLQEPDFAVLDNGRPQNVRMDTWDVALTPISLVILVQATEVSGPALAKIRKVGSLIEPLITGERGEAAILSFTDEIHSLQDFTHDAGRIGTAFRKLKTGGDQARAIDAVAEAIERLRGRPENSRKIVLLISESRDRGSKASLAEVLQSAQRSNVIIYPLTFSVHATAWTAKPEDAPSTDGGGLLAVFVELARLGKTNTAEAMARFTGGRRISFLTQRGLEADISRLGEELHSQYVLSFAPTQSEGDTDFHSLEVRVKGWADLLIQARPGYWPR